MLCSVFLTVHDRVETVHCSGLGAGSSMAANAHENLHFGENPQMAVKSPFLDGFHSFLVFFSSFSFLRVFSTNLTWIFGFCGFVSPNFIPPNGDLH